jgi:hypothetical protein
MGSIYVPLLGRARTSTSEEVGQVQRPYFSADPGVALGLVGRQTLPAVGDFVQKSNLLHCLRIATHAADSLRTTDTRMLACSTQPALLQGKQPTQHATATTAGLGEHQSRVMSSVPCKRDGYGRAPCDLPQSQSATFVHVSSDGM